MRKKSIVLMFIITMMVSMFANIGFAAEKSKTIVINMNRTNLNYMDDIPSLKKELESRGYIGLMNVRGDGGSDEKRSYASMGAGAKTNVVSSGIFEEFSELSTDETKLYSSATNKKALSINNPGINKILNHNTQKGQYGAVLGSLGESLANNNLVVSALGNSDKGFEEEDYNRNFVYMAMDENGRVPLGNVNDINIEDTTMPFGIRTDYNKLKEDTAKYYNSSDVMFVDLGDTYRLDAYKEYLNDESFVKMRKSIYKNIDGYLSFVFDLINKNDNVYIVSAYPSTIDNKNKRKLSPVIKFTDDNKGILASATTRRDGIISNVDIGVDILNNYGIKNTNMVGKTLTTIEKDDNIDYLNYDFEKIVSMSKTRPNAVNCFVVIVASSWIIAVLLLVIKNKLPKGKGKFIFKVLKELIKLGMIVPLAFLLAPITGASTQVGIITSIVCIVAILELIGHLLFKRDDIKQLGFYAFITITVIAIDSVFGTYLMKNNIMSYDALIGARYYGIGNEYEGITIASVVFALSVITQYNKKIPKWLMAIFLGTVLITSAHPSMGANVGGAISETVAYVVFMLFLFDIKIDFKKAFLILVAVCLVVGGFAISDIIMGTESHLSLFVNQILANGPSAIIQTFGRKIAMNVKLAKSSIWVNLLLAGIFIVGGLIFKPGKHFADMKNKYPMIFKGFGASMIGCITTLLVNDSGIVAAATASIYILIPLVIIIINMIMFKNDDKKEV